MSDDPNSDITHLLERLDYWEKFIPSKNPSEIENLLQQAITTIKELRQHAKKWKEYSDYHDMIADEFATENAELKRQVEALREDAKVGRLVKQLVEQTGEGSGVVELWKDMGVYCYSNAYSARVVAQFPSLIETLREAAKGEVE